MVVSPSEVSLSRLTPKQEALCQEYLVDLNATQAAIRAGYSPKTAKQQGSRLLTNADVQGRPEEGLAVRGLGHCGGGMFTDPWKQETCVVKPFKIPRSWRVDRSLDWGSSAPFSVGWWAEADGSEIRLADGTKRTYSRGTLFRIHEWYGAAEGKANTGLRMTTRKIAERIVESEKVLKERLGIRTIHPGPADSSIWNEADESVGGGRLSLEADQKRSTGSGKENAIGSDEMDSTRKYRVVINHEEQFSIWPVDREVPRGWNDAGKVGTRRECLDHISEVWTDMRPLSLEQREELLRKMEQVIAADSRRRS